MIQDASDPNHVAVGLDPADFPHLSPELVRAFASFRSPPGRRVPRPPYWRAMRDAAAPPAERAVDWRRRGIVPDPRAQGGCNACTSFAIAAAVEALHARRRGERILLSPGYIHWCLRQAECLDGFDLLDAAALIAAHGIGFAFPNDYPYPREACSTANVYTIGRQVPVPGPNAAKHALVSAGPIVADMYIGPAFLAHNDERVFKGPDGDTIHCVCVVGFDDDMDGGAWIVLNSMGSGWGSRRSPGTAHVAYGTGKLLTARTQAVQFHLR